MMQVLIAGATGLVGRALSANLLADGHQVRVLSRQSASALTSLGDKVKGIEWSTTEPLPAAALAGIEAVVNLAGENIGAGRWTDARKERIMTSRRDTTRNIVLGIAQCQERPQLLINASAVGYYGPHGDEEVTETDGPGKDFLAQVCRAWEQEACQAEDLGVRVVRLRFGIVLAGEGGTLARLLLPFRLRLGGPLGSGRQWVSWIHMEDVLGLIRLALDETELSGPVNTTAPQPVRMTELASTLGKVLRRPARLRAPEKVLRVALGEMAEMILTGQRVLPARALAAGYTFRFPSLEVALRNLLQPFSSLPE